MLLSTIAPFRRILSLPSSPFNSPSESFCSPKNVLCGCLPPLNHFLYSHPRALTPTTALLVVLFSTGYTLEIAVVVYATQPPLSNHSTSLCRTRVGLLLCFIFSVCLVKLRSSPEILYSPSFVIHSFISRGVLNKAASGWRATMDPLIKLMNSFSFVVVLSSTNKSIDVGRWFCC